MGKGERGLGSGNRGSGIGDRGSGDVDRAIDEVARELTSLDAPADLKARVLTELAESHAPAFKRRALGGSLQWAMAGAAAAVVVASLAWWVAMPPTTGPAQRFAGEVGGRRSPIVSAPAAGGARAEETIATSPAAASPVVRRDAVQRSVAAQMPDDAMSDAPTMVAIATIEAIAQSPVEIEQIIIAPIAIPELTAIAPIEISEVSGSEVQ